MDRFRTLTSIDGARKALRARVARFVRAEEGSLLILSIFIFLTMLVMSAMTLDFMRQEEVRQRVQNTADRAALAAADLNQKLNPKDVVDDYFAKDGLSGVGYTVVVKENTYGSSRTVEVKADSKVNRTFADLVAPQIRSLPIKIQSKAEESIGKVELSLVLDISGSMNDVPPNSYSNSSSNGKTRLQRMIPAAQSFVTQMFDVVQPTGAEPGRLMMSIVPYSTQVALNGAMLNGYTLSNDYTIINSKFRKERCVDFQVSDYNSLAINPNAELQRTMYGDSWNFSRYVSSSDSYKYYYNYYWNNCTPLAANEILPYSNDKAELLAKIKNLTADGNTSIDIGAKWGLGLLDPSAKVAMTRMIASNGVKSMFAGRPTEYGADADAMKVMVLMTDGANTMSYSTKPAYRSGVSPIKSLVGTNTVTLNDTSTFVYYDASRGSAPYYNYGLNKWQKASDFTVSYSWTTTCYSWLGWPYSCTKTDTRQADFYDVSYETLYQTNVYRPTSSYSYAPLNLFGAAYFFGIPYGRSVTQQYALMAERSENNLPTNETQKDKNMHSICSLARQQGVLVFTIAVDPNDSTYDYSSILAKCATTNAYAFTVDSSAMADAFSTIVSNINALRLSN